MASLDHVVLPIPTAHRREHIHTVLGGYRDWFYEFPFANGTAIAGADEITREIHRTRAELIFPVLDVTLEHRWPELSCLDVACHQGWFAFQLALRGANRVLGIDVRKEHIQMAAAVKGLSTLTNVEFREGNLFALSAGPEEQYDLTFFLGILYHLDNPIEALRIARAVTKGLLILESQVARPVPPLECLWGGGAPGQGPAIALVTADRSHAEGDRPFALVPTLKALYAILHGVGFQHLHLAIPSPTMHQQYLGFDRVVIFAQ